MSDSIEALLQSADPDAPAIGAPGRDWLTHDGLSALSVGVRDSLNGFGIGPTDRVAIVLPNGPEMAAAFVTVAQSACTAPLADTFGAPVNESYGRIGAAHQMCSNPLPPGAQ